MDEIIKSVKAFLYDRATSPLFGAFVAAWSTWNYKFFLIITSENLSYYEKSSAIDQAFSVIRLPFFAPTKADDLYIPINSFIIPAAISLLYIYLYPLAAKPIFSYSLGKNKEILKIKQASDSLRLLSEKESSEIFLMLSQAEDKAAQESDYARRKQSALIQEIESLKLELNALNLKSPQEGPSTSAALPDEDLPSKLDPKGLESTKESRPHQRSGDALYEALKEESDKEPHIPVTDETLNQAVKILVFLSNYGIATSREIYERTSINKTKTEAILKVLLEKQFIVSSGDFNELSSKGKQYLLKAGLI